MRHALAVVLMVLASVETASAVDRLVSTRGNDQSGANPCNPLPCKTVTQAVAQAGSGDVIKVAKGTYKGSITLDTTGTWTIRGGYPLDFNEAARDVVKNKTTLGGAKNNRFLLIHAESGDVITVALDGVTVSNSKTLFPVTPPPFPCCGGGILAVAEGGSIDLDLHQVTMMSNSTEGAGGALSLQADSGAAVTARITDSAFKKNKVVDFGIGGAIAVEGFPGGTIDLTIEDTRFDGNKAFMGGAIFIGSGDTPGVTTTIRRSLFLANGAAGLLGGDFGGGGAIDVIAEDFGIGNPGHAALTMENSVLQGNSAGMGGAIRAISFINGSPGTAQIELDLRNNTIVANKATVLFGGGLAVLAAGLSGAPADSSTVTGTLLNNIVRGNTAPSFPTGGDITFLPEDDGAATSFTLTTNNIGTLENFGTVAATPDPQLNVDPKLVKKQGVSRLKLGSPMIGAGTCDGAPTDDFEGNTRPTGTGSCGVDIGADEF